MYLKIQATLAKVAIGVSQTLKKIADNGSNAQILKACRRIRLESNRRETLLVQPAR